MPYIKQEQRINLETKLQSLVDQIVDLVRKEGTFRCIPGVLNYLTTSLIKRSYNQSIEAESSIFALEHEKKLSYADYNEMIGMLECCKLELYRRAIAPYEDQKVKENGDV